MNNIKIWICVNLFLCINTLAAQQINNLFSTNEWAVRLGYTEYCNSTVIANGLPGFSTAIIYNYEKYIKKGYPYNFEFQTKLSYGYLAKPDDNSELIKPYHHAEFSLGALWTYRVIVSKLDIEAGGGVLFNLLAGYNTGFKFNDNYFAHLQPYGNWLLMPSAKIGFQYQLNKIRLKTKLIFPLCVGGFYQEYQNFPYIEEKIASYIFTPNTLALFNKYTAVFAEMNCYIPLNLNSTKKTDLIIGIYIDTTNGNINYISEKKRNIGISLGVQY